jgi:hypothetical protein
MLAALMLLLLAAPALAEEKNVPYPELPPPPAEKKVPAQERHVEGHAHHEIPADVLLQIRVAAEAGDANAQGALGELYHEGTGMERDLRKAFYWFRKGAENGDEQSMLYLARYYKGEYPQLRMNRDWDEAEKWLLILARKGDGNAMATLGALLFERVRNGETHRLEEATWWYNRATGGPWDPDYVPPSLMTPQDDEKTDEALPQPE